MRLADLITNGLEDRVDLVRIACSEMIVDYWLPFAKSLVNLLQYLQVDEEQLDLVWVFS